MKYCFALILAISSGASATSANSAPQELDVPEEIRQSAQDYFVVLQAAVQGEDVTALANLILLAETAIRAMEKAGVEMSHVERTKLREVLPKRIATQLMTVFSGWSRHTIRFLEWDQSESEGVILLRVIEVDGITLKMKLSLTKTDTGWAITDFEDLGFGISFSDLNYAIAVQMSAGRFDRETLQALHQLTQVIQLVQAEDFSSASEFLVEMDDVALPESMMPFVWICKATVSLAEYDPKEALLAIQMAEAFNRRLPCLLFLKASACLALEDYETALKSAESYIEQCGTDADVAWIQGMALHGLKRTEDAVHVLQNAAKETPESGDLVAALALALPESRKAEAADLFLELAYPWESLELVADSLIEQEDNAALKAIITAAEVLLADHPWLPYYQAEILVNEEQYTPAADVLLPLLGSSDETLQISVEYRFVECMVKCRRHIEAYRALAKSVSAFRTIADHLLSEERYDGLMELIKEHRQQFPDDSEACWYEGQFLMHREEWEQAERVLTLALQYFKPDNEELWFYAESILAARIECLVMLDRSIEGCRNLGGDEEIVLIFAEILLENDRISQLKTFLVEFPVSTLSERRRLKAGIAFFEKDHEQVITLLDPPQSAFWKRIFSVVGELTEPEHDLLIRSLISTGNIKDARRQATQYAQTYDDPFYVALCEAADGNVSECSRLLLQCVSDDGHYFAGLVLRDKQLMGYLAEEQFADLRKKLETQSGKEIAEFGSVFE